MEKIDTIRTTDKNLHVSYKISYTTYSVGFSVLGDVDSQTYDASIYSISSIISSQRDKRQLDTIRTTDKTFLGKNPCHLHSRFL